MAIAFVKNVGSATGTSTTVVITVPAGGVAAGNILLLRSSRAASESQPTVADTQGNTYTLAVGNTASPTGGVFRCLVSVALVSGNTITATFGAMGTRVAVADEFSGTDNTEEGENLAGNTSTTPSSGAITQTSAACLLHGHVAVAAGTADTYTEDADTAGGGSWQGLTRAANGTSVTTNAAYKITTSAVSQTYNPTLGTSRAWTATIVALKETASAFLAPRPIQVNQAIMRGAYR